MDKLTEMISLRVPSIVKEEWDALSDEQKKHCKRMVMDTMCRYLFAVNHYDKRLYFGDERIDL